MSDKSVDLSSTPADSTRFKLRQNKKMVDNTNKVFKVPNPPSVTGSNSNYITRSKQRIRSVAERKSDLLSKWSGECDSPGNSKDKRGNNNRVDAPLEDNTNSNAALKLARYRYVGEYLNGEREDDKISLGESAKMTQAKLKAGQRENGTEFDYANNYGQDHDHEGDTDASQPERETDEHDEGSDTGTKHTDVSAAQSNIAEQAEIAERRELESMKELVQNDSSVEEVLRFVLEKLTMLQIGIKEIKTEQSNLTRRIDDMEQRENKTRKVTNYCINELQELTSTNFKLIQSTDTPGSRHRGFKKSDANL